MGLSREDWITNATLIGTAGWESAFQYLFFDPDGLLFYGVVWDKLRKRNPPPGGGGWYATSTVVGSSGWSDFEFLFFDPEGILYGVQNGKFHKRSPPANESDDWLGSSTLIGSTGWSDFQLLFFTVDYELYGVYEDKLYLVSQSDHWMASSTMVGSNGWSEFKFLMADWQLSKLSSDSKQPHNKCELECRQLNQRKGARACAEKGNMYVFFLQLEIKEDHATLFDCSVSFFLLERP